MMNGIPSLSETRVVPHLSFDARSAASAASARASDSEVRAAARAASAAATGSTPWH